MMVTDSMRRSSNLCCLLMLLNIVHSLLSIHHCLLYRVSLTIVSCNSIGHSIFDAIHLHMVCVAGTGKFNVLGVTRTHCEAGQNLIRFVFFFVGDFDVRYSLLSKWLVTVVCVDELLSAFFKEVAPSLLGTYAKQLTQTGFLSS